MNNFLTIFDQHGHDDRHQYILNRLHENFDNLTTITNGDTDVSFAESRNSDGSFNRRIPKVRLGENDYILLGNHDGKLKARELRNYICDWKYFEEFDVLVISGGHTPSFDRTQRTIGIDLFEDEEMSEKEMSQCLEFYTLNRPQIIISHEGPTEACRLMKSNLFPPSRTMKLLDSMLKEHRPSQWIMGHWHTYLEKEVCGTNFTCRPELQVYDILNRANIVV